MLLSVVSVDHDMAFLPHFLRHYTSIGIDPRNMVLTLHQKQHNTTQLQHALASITGYPVMYHTWVGPFNTFEKFEVQVR